MRPAQTLMEVIRALVVLATVATALHVMVCKYVITVQFSIDVHHINEEASY